MSSNEQQQQQSVTPSRPIDLNTVVDDDDDDDDDEDEDQEQAQSFSNNHIHHNNNNDIHNNMTNNHYAQEGQLTTTTVKEEGNFSYYKLNRPSTDETVFIQINRYSTPMIVSVFDFSENINVGEWVEMKEMRLSEHGGEYDVSGVDQNDASYLGARVKVQPHEDSLMDEQESALRRGSPSSSTFASETAAITVTATVAAPATMDNRDQNQGTANPSPTRREDDILNIPIRKKPVLPPLPLPTNAAERARSNGSGRTTPPPPSRFPPQNREGGASRGDRRLGYNNEGSIGHRNNQSSSSYPHYNSRGGRTNEQVGVSTTTAHSSSSDRRSRGIDTQTMTEEHVSGVVISERTAMMLLQSLVRLLESTEVVVDSSGATKRTTEVSLSSIAHGFTESQKKSIISRYLNEVLFKGCEMVSSHNKERILNFLSGTYISSGAGEVEKILLHQFMDNVQMTVNSVFFEMNTKDRTWRRYMKTRKFSDVVSNITQEIEVSKMKTNMNHIYRRHTNFSKTMDSNIDRFIIVANPKRILGKTDLRTLLVQKCGISQVIEEYIKVVHHPVLPCIATIGFSCPIIDDEDYDLEDIPQGYRTLTLQTITAMLGEEAEKLQPRLAQKRDVKYFMKVLRGLNSQNCFVEELFSHPKGTIKTFVKSYKPVFDKVCVRLNRAEGRAIDRIDSIFIIDFECLVALSNATIETVIPVEIAAIQLNMNGTITHGFHKILNPHKIPRDKESIAEYTRAYVHGVSEKDGSHDWIGIWSAFLSFLGVDSCDAAKNCILVSQNAGAANACMRWFYRAFTDDMNQKRTSYDYNDVGDVWYNFMFDHVAMNDVVLDVNTFLERYPTTPISHDQIIRAKFQTATYLSPERRCAVLHKNKPGFKCALEQAYSVAAMLQNCIANEWNNLRPPVVHIADIATDANSSESDDDIGNNRKRRTS